MASVEFKKLYLTGNFQQHLQEFAEKLGKPELSGKVGAVSVNSDSATIIYIDKNAK